MATLLYAKGPGVSYARLATDEALVFGVNYYLLINANDAATRLTGCMAHLHCGLCKSTASAAAAAAALCENGAALCVTMHVRGTLVCR